MLRSSVCHLPADEQRVGELAETPQHADLVVHLGAADDRDVRPLGRLDEPPELPQLALEQQAGIGRQEVRDSLGRGVRAVRGPEGVVYVEVQPRRELAREHRIVLGLTRVEARVLEHADAPVAASSSRSRASTGAIR